MIQDLDNQLFSGNAFSRIIPDGSRIWINATPYRKNRSREIALIQELPTQTMLFPELSYMDNLCFTLDHRMPQVWHNSSIRRSLRQDYGSILGQEVFDLPVSALTQRQKYDLVYTRVLLQHPQVVFCVQPFKGAEMAQRMHISELLERLLQKGIGVVILAVNLADSLTLANRVLRLEKGQPHREFERKDFPSLPQSTPWRNLYEEPEDPPLNQTT